MNPSSRMSQMDTIFGNIDNNPKGLVKIARFIEPSIEVMRMNGEARLYGMMHVSYIHKSFLWYASTLLLSQKGKE